MYVRHQATAKSAKIFLRVRRVIFKIKSLSIFVVKVSSLPAFFCPVLTTPSSTYCQPRNATHPIVNAQRRPSNGKRAKSPMEECTPSTSVSTFNSTLFLFNSPAFAAPTHPFYGALFVHYPFTPPTNPPRPPPLLFLYVRPFVPLACAMNPHRFQDTIRYLRSIIRLPSPAKKKMPFKASTVQQHTTYVDWPVFLPLLTDSRREAAHTKPSISCHNERP